MLFFIYILIWIVQIFLLVMSIKKKQTYMWLGVLAFEFMAFITAIMLQEYFSSLPTDENDMFGGFAYFSEILSSFGAKWVYVAMIFITTSAWIITFEKNLKERGKVHANPIRLIIAVACFMVGIYFLYDEIVSNIGIMEGRGTIVDIGESENSYVVRNGIRQKMKETTISFTVEGKEYQDKSYYEVGQEIGDEIDIYYSGPNFDDEYDIRYYKVNNKLIYITVFVIGIMIVVYRIRRNNKWSDLVI